MKQISKICLILLLTSTSVHADEEIDWRGFCSTTSNLAESIMRNRQDGISMAQSIKAANEVEFAEKLIIRAYGVPRFQAEKNRQRSIEDFRDEIYLECVEGLKELIRQRSN